MVSPHSGPSASASLESPPEKQPRNGAQNIAPTATNTHRISLRHRKPKGQPAKSGQERLPIHPKSECASSKPRLGRTGKRSGTQGGSPRPKPRRRQQHAKMDKDPPESKTEPVQSAEPVGWPTLHEAFDHMAIDEGKAREDDQAHEDTDEQEAETLEYTGYSDSDPHMSTDSGSAQMDPTSNEGNSKATENTGSHDWELLHHNRDEADPGAFDAHPTDLETDAEERTRLLDQAMNEDILTAPSTPPSHISNFHVASNALLNPTDVSATVIELSAKDEIDDFFDIESEGEENKATSNAEPEAIAKSKAMREHRAELHRRCEAALRNPDALAPQGP